MTLAAGCFINLAPKLLPLLALLKRQQQPTLLETYQILKEYLGYRPTARQTWVARLGEQLRFDTQKQGGWFELLAQAGDLGEEELRVLNRHGDFLRAGVENTALSRMSPGVRRISTSSRALRSSQADAAGPASAVDAERP